MIIRNGKATYDTDTNTFSFTFPMAQGEGTITLTNGKLRKNPDEDRLYRYAYYYGIGSNEKTREAFEQYIYGLSAAGRSDAKFLAKYSVEALFKTIPFSDFDAMCCRTYHIDALCRDIADEISKFGELHYLTEDEPKISADKILVLDNKPGTFAINKQRSRYHESTFVTFSPIPDIEESAYCGQTLTGYEKGVKPKIMPLQELIDRYAANHKEGFTIVIPHVGDLDEFVGEIVEQRGYNAVIIPHNPEDITPNLVYEEILYNDKVLRQHYRDRFNEVLLKIWNSLHYDYPDDGESGWEAFYKPSYLHDKELSEQIGLALSVSKMPQFRDCRLMNGRDVLVIDDREFHQHLSRFLDCYSTKSLTFFWVKNLNPPFDSRRGNFNVSPCALSCDS